MARTTTVLGVSAGAGAIAAGAVYYLASRTPPEPVPAEETVPAAPPGQIAPPIEAQIQALEQAVVELDQAIEEAQATLEEIGATVDEQAVTIARLEEDVRGLRQRVQELEAILAELTDTGDRLAQQNRELAGLADELAAEYGERDARFRQLQALVAEQRQTIQQLREQVARLAQQIELLDAQIAQLDRDVATLRAQNDQLRSQVETLREQLVAARARIQALEETIADLKRQLELVPVEQAVERADFTVGLGNPKGFLILSPGIVVEQEVTITWTIHRQFKCSWLVACDGGRAEARLQDAQGRVVAGNVVGGVIGQGANASVTKTATVRLSPGGYRLWVDVDSPGRAYIKIVYKAPRFLVQR